MKTKITKKIIALGAALLTAGAVHFGSPAASTAGIELEIKTGYDRFYRAPKQLENFETPSTKASLTKTGELSDKLSAGATGSLMAIGNPFLSNERYGSDFKPELTLDRAWLEYTDGGLEVLAGKFEDPFAVNLVSYDKDLRPEGAAVSYTAEKLGFLASLKATLAKYLKHDINNNPSASLTKAELFGKKKVGKVGIGAGASYTDVDSVEGPSRTGSKDGEYKFAEAGGKVVVQVGDGKGIISSLTGFGNYAYNFANGDESKLIGARADLLESRFYIDGALFDKDKDPFPAAISHDHIPPTNCRGYKVGAGWAKELSEKATVGMDANWYNPTLKNGQEVQHWDFSANVKYKF